jgi:uncharacterized membrane protein
MNILCLAALKDNLPPELLKNISFGLLIIIAVAGVFCIIKCVQGADMLDRGEDGKKKIYSGIAIGMAPWIAIAAFRATNLADVLGLQDFKSLGKLPQQLIDATQVALWIVVGIALIWCVAKCVEGADMLDRGADGKKKIYSGIAIAAAPWIAVGALNATGLWSDLGLQFF